MSWPHRRLAFRRRSKYGAKRQTIDGVTFASRRESKRYVELKALLRAGRILELQTQPRFPIVVGELVQVAPGTALPVLDRPLTHVASYVADFSYYLASNGEFVVEDTKGFRTETYRLKKRLVEASYGFRIQEL